MTYWPWWMGGLALGVVAIGYFVSVGRLLGVSGSLAVLLRWREERQLATERAQMAARREETEAALLAATREAFGDDLPSTEDDPEPAPPAASPSTVAAAGPLPWTAHGLLLVGIALGAAVSSLLRGGLRTSMGPDFARLIGTGWKAAAMLVAGGLLVGFGTTMAGGCTSGHGLCGAPRLQPGSLVATAAFFGAAVGVSLLLARVMS